MYAHSCVISLYPVTNSDYRPQEELTSLRDEVSFLRSQLIASEEKNSLLEHQLHLLKNKLTNAKRDKNDSVNALNLELEEKSSSIAYLVTQLHQAKRMLYKSFDNQDDSNKPRFTPHPPSQPPHRPRPPSQPPLTPHPPSQPPPQRRLTQDSTTQYQTGQIVRRMRRTSSSPSGHRRISAVFQVKSSFPSQSPSLSGSALHKQSKESGQTSPSLSPVWVNQLQPTPPPYPPVEHLRHVTKTTHSDTRSSISQHEKIVLPPILSTTAHHQDNGISSQHRLTRDEPITTEPIKPGLTPRTGTSHRRLILAKSQGLSSAPTSLRRYHYPTTRTLERNTEEFQEDLKRTAEDEEDTEDDMEMAEGMLVVKQGLGAQSSRRQLHQSHTK